MLRGLAVLPSPRQDGAVFFLHNPTGSGQGGTHLPSPITVGSVGAVRGCLGVKLEALGATQHRTLPTPPPAPLQVEGRWLTIRLATSDTLLVSPEDPLRLALHSIRTWNRDLEFVLFWT